MGHDEALAGRVRRILGGRPDVVEKRMVGGLSFSVGDRMCCGVTGSALMIRVGPEARDTILERPFVRPMVLGGRRLAGFVLVDPEGVATDRALAGWIDHGIDFATALAGTSSGPSSSTPSTATDGGS